MPAAPFAFERSRVAANTFPWFRSNTGNGTENAKTTALSPLSLKCRPPRLSVGSGRRRASASERAADRRSSSVTHRAMSGFSYTRCSSLARGGAATSCARSPATEENCGTTLPQLTARATRAAARAPSARLTANTDGRELHLGARSLHVRRPARFGKRANLSDRISYEAFHLPKKLELLLCGQRSHERLRRVSQNAESHGLVLPLREITLQLGDAAPPRRLAADRNQLREPDGRLALLERGAIARAAQVLELDQNLRIGQKARLNGARIATSHLQRKDGELRVPNQRRGDGVAQGQRARRLVQRRDGFGRWRPGFRAGEVEPTGGEQQDAGERAEKTNSLHSDPRKSLGAHAVRGTPTGRDETGLENDWDQTSRTIVLRCKTAGRMRGLAEVRHARDGVGSFRPPRDSPRRSPTT